MLDRRAHLCLINKNHQYTCMKDRALVHNKHKSPIHMLDRRAHLCLININHQYMCLIGVRKSTKTCA